MHIVVYLCKLHPILQGFLVYSFILGSVEEVREGILCSKRRSCPGVCLIPIIIASERDGDQIHSKAFSDKESYAISNPAAD